MRKALANAAQRYGLPVHLPNIATLQSNQIRIDTAAVILGQRLSRVAKLSDGECLAWMGRDLEPSGKRAAFPLVRQRRQL